MDSRLSVAHHRVPSPTTRRSVPSKKKRRACCRTSQPSDSHKLMRTVERHGKHLSADFFSIISAASVDPSSHPRIYQIKAAQRCGPHGRKNDEDEYDAKIVSRRGPACPELVNISASTTSLSITRQRLCVAATRPGTSNSIGGCERYMDSMNYLDAHVASRSWINRKVNYNSLLCLWTLPDIALPLYQGSAMRRTASWARK